MPKVVIIQRVVPSYRLKVYERLWKDLGWVVAYGRNIGTEGMKLEQGEKFLKGYDFTETRFGIIKVPVARIISDLQPDAIIAEGALRMSSTWELIARRKLFGGPRLYFWSIGYNASKSGKPEENSSQWIYPAVYRHADGCLAYGPDGRQFLASRLGGKPVFVAQNSIDMDAIREARGSVPPLAKRGFPELVSVSRITPMKEYVKLVDAFHLVLKRFPEAHLTIIGDGPELDRIKHAAGEELGRHIHLTGALYDERQIAPYMNRADAFVMTGRVGLSINHALGYNLPVICFERGEKGPFHGSEASHLIAGVTGRAATGYEAADFANEVISVFTQQPEFKAAHREAIESYVAANLSVDVMVKGFHSIDAHLRGMNSYTSSGYAEQT